MCSTQQQTEECGLVTSQRDMNGKNVWFKGCAQCMLNTHMSLGYCSFRSLCIVCHNVNVVITITSLVRLLNSTLTSPKKKNGGKLAVVFIRLSIRPSVHPNYYMSTPLPTTTYTPLPDKISAIPIHCNTLRQCNAAIVVVVLSWTGPPLTNPKWCCAASALTQRSCLYFHDKTKCFPLASTACS